MNNVPGLWPTNLDARAAPSGTSQVERDYRSKGIVM